MTTARIIGTILIFLSPVLSIAGIKAYPITTVIGIIFIIYAGFHPPQHKRS